MGPPAKRLSVLQRIAGSNPVPPALSEKALEKLIQVLFSYREMFESCSHVASDIIILLE
jgi:hypothetical protein